MALGGAGESRRVRSGLCGCREVKRCTIVSGRICSRRLLDMCFIFSPFPDKLNKPGPANFFFPHVCKADVCCILKIHICRCIFLLLVRNGWLGQVWSWDLENSTLLYYIRLFMAFVFMCFESVFLGRWARSRS